jgi:hypothetical protein
MGHGNPFPGKIFIITSFQHHIFKSGSHRLGYIGLALSEIFQPGGQVFSSLDRTQSDAFDLLPLSVHSIASKSLIILFPHKGCEGVG